MPTTTLTKNPQAAGGDAATPQQRQPHRAPAAAEVAERSRAEIKRQLSYSFDNHLLESGMYHPAEKIIDEALSEHKDLAYQWLAEFCMDEEASSLAASVLFCLGRIPLLGAPEWRLAVVSNGLKSEDVSVRDAAAQAAETWISEDMAKVLEDHLKVENEGWLQDYIKNIMGHFQAK